MAKDLFGEEIIEDPILRDKFIEPPFSVLDTKSGNWARRKKLWKTIGIKSEIGRDVTLIKDTFNSSKYGRTTKINEVSIFDPALCEVLYHWFCPQNGTILDPFAGGSVRGIVANKLGYKYTGIDIREEQIESNKEQGLNILGDNCPEWICNDSNKELDLFDRQFDFVFSCPPYVDLEVYSDLDGDISNKPYNEFMSLYESIIKKSCQLLKRGGYACFVVGEVRDKQGNYIGFVPDTINAFKNCGMKFYNEGILLDQLGTACMRADRQFSAGQKLVKVHQNILVFKKD